MTSREEFEKWWEVNKNNVDLRDSPTVLARAAWQAAQPKWISVDDRTKLLTLLQAVGHVGVDFGYGPYNLGADEIKTAQELYSKLLPSAPEEDES